MTRRSKSGRTLFRTLLTSVIGVGLVGYFAYHTVQGNRGVLSLVTLMSETGRLAGPLCDRPLPPCCSRTTTLLLAI